MTMVQHINPVSYTHLDVYKRQAGENDCLKNGQETYCCKKCRTEETVILPASGHYDSDGDSLCDRCKKRAFPAQLGDRIRTVLQTESGEKELVFRCLDLNYRGSGNMLYLSEETLGEDTVSYTHLDVYKRQPISTAEKCFIRT